VLVSDRCEDLCSELSFTIDDCMPSAFDWPDFGASSRQAWAGECRRDWERLRTDLSSRELELALDECRQTREDLPGWTCDEVMALYGPVR